MSSFEFGRAYIYHLLEVKEMNASKNIAKRVNELIDKYSNSPNSVQYLLCDHYPPNKIAYKIINENNKQKLTQVLGS